MSDQIDLLGWDTVFGISYKSVNQAIVKSKGTPSDFNYENSGSKVTISGDWSDWQLSIGGDGQNLQMTCPIASGSVVSDGKTGDLAGGIIEIQVKLSAIPDPKYDPGKQVPGTGGTPHLFKVNADGSIENPSVSIITSTFPNISDQLLKTALPQIFQEYFIDNIASFNHVFAAVDINLKADKGDYQWLMPTSTSYACAPARDQTLDNSVFGVLCTTDDSSSGLLENAIDARILENLPTGTNSAFCISENKMLEHILLPGAVYNIQGSKAEDFHIINDNNWIATNKDLTWGNFELDNGHKISPVIKAGNFQMGIENNFVVIKVIDATCEWTGWHGPGDINLHLNMTQYFELELKKTSKGYVLMPKPLFDKNGDKIVSNGSVNINCNVSVSEGVQIFEICTGIAAAIVGSILGAVLGAAVDAAGTVTVKTTTEAAIEMSTVEWVPLIVRDSQGEIQEMEQASFQAAAESVENAGSKGFVQSFASALNANKWKVFAGILGSAMGAQIGLIAKYMKMAADGDLDSIPTFNNFAANCVGTTTFPGNTGWDLKAVNLNGSLLITGDLLDADVQEKPEQSLEGTLV